MSSVIAPAAGRTGNRDHAERVTSLEEEEEDSPLDRKQTIAIWYATLTLMSAHLREAVATRHTKAVLHIG